MPPTLYTVQLTGGRADLAGLLDMLRYEGATVRDWRQTDGGSFVVVIESERPTPDRWRSFLLFPQDPRTGRAL